MYDEVCVQGERDVSAEVKITNEEINNIRQKMKRRRRINLIRRNYPRTKMTLNLSHLKRFKRGAQTSSLCGEVANVKKLYFHELKQWIQQHHHHDCSKSFM